MIRTGPIIALALLASACEPESAAADKAIADARDVARVEAVQNAPPPVRRFAPEPITAADIEKHKLLGAGCRFEPERGGAIVLLALREAAYMKLEGDMRVYAADSGSPALGNDIRTRYEGREAVIDLQTAGGEGTPSGTATIDWPGRLTVRDPYDRVVYGAVGTVRCSE